MHRLCGVVARYPDWVCYIAVHRGPGQAAYGDKDKRRLQGILPHLCIAMNNHWRLLRASGLNHVLWSVIDHFENATFLVARDGLVVHRNRQADELMQRFGELRLCGDTIVVAKTVEHRALLAALHEIIDASMNGLADRPSDISKVVTLSRSRAEQPIIVTLRPIGSVFGTETGTYRSLVILTAKYPSDAPHPHRCSFSKLYQLTPAQARLSALVFSGCTLTEAAKQLHVSENTVRSHLKQIYLKTHTHGQVELVQLHARVCDDHL